jgi:hypothetical protein
MNEGPDFTPPTQPIEKPAPMQGTFTAEDLRENSTAWEEYRSQTDAARRRRENEDAIRLKEIEDQLATGVQPTSEMVGDYLSTPRTPEQELKQREYIKGKLEQSQPSLPQDKKKKGNWLSRIFSKR